MQDEYGLSQKIHRWKKTVSSCKKYPLFGPPQTGEEQFAFAVHMYTFSTFQRNDSEHSTLSLRNVLISRWDVAL